MLNPSRDALFSLDPGPSSKVAQNHYHSLGSVSHIDKKTNIYIFYFFYFILLLLLFLKKFPQK
jgi:hypothetical protein